MISLKKLLFLLAFCSVLTLVSCNKDDDDNMSDDFITATIDGNEFEAESLTTMTNTSMGIDFVLATGSNKANTYVISLKILTIIPINMPQESDEFDFSLTFSDADNNPFLTEGTFEVSNNDLYNNIMNGTFSFTATNDNDTTDVHEITAGEFRISY